MYNSKLTKKCNWGDHRVPNPSEDFDIGAGFFSPNKKYEDMGWRNYIRAWVNGDEEARKKEKEPWWK